MSIQALQNSLNIESGLGVKSLACLYSTCIVSSLLSPTFIKVFGQLPFLRAGGKESAYKIVDKSYLTYIWCGK
jgi:hypothetical protein